VDFQREGSQQRLPFVGVSVWALSWESSLEGCQRIICAARQKFRGLPPEQWAPPILYQLSQDNNQTQCF